MTDRFANPPSEVPQWCEERLRQPQEDLDLARLFTAREQRPAVAASAAIYIELEAIATRFRDLNVARAKFGWWHEELARLDEGRPAHPATRSLAGGTDPPAAAQLLDLVTGMELNLLAGPPADLSEAEAWSERGFAQWTAALAAALDPAGTADYGALGVAIGLARCLQAPSAAGARDDIAAVARSRLRATGMTWRASPPPLRVLAALAWQRVARGAAGEPSRRERRRRVFVAWRAARGKLPRGLGGG